MEVLYLFLQLATLSVLAWLLIFPKRYIGEKGKNLATKEDIGEITNEIEKVKNQYSADLEGLKAGLSHRAKYYGYRYEREFQVLEELTSLLVDVRDSVVSLRPMLDSRPSGKSDGEIKEERLKRYYDARRKLYDLREKKRPFFPGEIYDCICDLDRISRGEALDYHMKNPFDDDDPKAFLKYWMDAEKNREEVEVCSNKAIELIRERITQWDSI